MKRRKKGCSLIRVEMHPQHANGAIVNGVMQVFGGDIMGFMDTAAASAARDICANQVVTRRVREIVFDKSVFVGDVLECYAEVTEIGRTSMTINITVDAVRRGETIRVTEGEMTFVSVDQNIRPIPVIGWDGKRPRIRRKAASSDCSHRCASCGSVSKSTKEAPKS